MIETSPAPVKVTYATMRADQMESLHQAMEEAAARIIVEFGRTHPMIIDGHEVLGPSAFDDTSPIDTRIVLGRFQRGTREDAKQAIEAARRAFPSWSARSWEERVRSVREAGQMIRDQRWAR